MLLPIFPLTLVVWTAFSAALLADDGLSPLGETPDWSRVEAYQETITREAFLEAMLIE